jgi:nucleoside permease NupC
MKDGGTYTLAVQGTTSGISSFMGVNPSGTAFVFKSINNGTTIAGKDTLYTFVVMGTTVYVYMATGF